jgi:hypothetical protein
MNNSMDATALRTIELLEHRLEKVRFLLSGDDRREDDVHRIETQGKNHTVLARLSLIENQLNQLAERSPVVRRLLQLCRWWWW